MRPTSHETLPVGLQATARRAARQITLWMMGMALITLVPPVSAQDASRIDVQAERNGDLIDVRAQALVHAPLSVVWSTLTDYERLPQFIPGLQTSRIVSRDGNRVTVAQTGQARFLFLTMPITVTVESTERPPHVVEVRRISGTLRHLQGRYEATPVSTQLVQLLWTGSVSPEADLPPLINTALARLSIEDQFTGMVREIERRAGYKPPAPPPTVPSDRRLAR
jgi:ribosome-associated toxin RatA of RatAB toxin-antitoxin module